MNTTLAFILTVVVTNWTSIGTLTDKSGTKFDVEEGRIQTNTVARIVWGEKPMTLQLLGRAPVWWWEDAKTNDFILKSVDGQIAGEKRIPLVNWFRSNQTVTNFWWPAATNIYRLTNTPVPTTSSDAAKYDYRVELDSLLMRVWLGKTDLLLTNRTHVLTNGIIMSLEELGLK